MIRVFSYKSVLGFDAIDVETGELSEHIINNLEDGNQLGIVVNASGVTATKEAIEILHSIKPGRDAIGDVDMFKTNDGKGVFAWLGGVKGLVDTRRNPEGSSTYDNLVTDDFTVAEIQTPDEFKQVVDGMLGEKA